MNCKNVATLRTRSRKTGSGKKLKFYPKKSLSMLRKMPKQRFSSAPRLRYSKLKLLTFRRRLNILLEATVFSLLYF
jgi:hypothetical protein